MFAGVRHIVHQSSALSLRRRVGDVRHNQPFGHEESVCRAGRGLIVFRYVHIIGEACLFTDAVVFLLLYDVVADIPSHNGLHRLLVAAASQHGQFVRHTMHLLLARIRHERLNLTIVSCEILPRNTEYQTEQISALHNLVGEITRKLPANLFPASRKTDCCVLSCYRLIHYVPSYLI